MKLPPTNVCLLVAACVLFNFANTSKGALVTFQVNMGAQSQRGSFHPATDTVLVAGDAINGWSTSASILTNSVADTNLWLETFDVPGDAGTVVQYKFIFNTPDAITTWEGNVGDNGAQNRSFVLSGDNQTLPVVYFNNVTNSTVVTIPVSFQVDLSVPIADGSFDPASGTVFVAGDAINNWSTSASMLTNSPAAPNIWAGTFPITEAPGATIAYKFVLNSSTWESRANRTFSLSSSAQTLPVVFFNDVRGPATDIPLTFAVDMSVQAALGTFNPNSDTVFTAGTFNGWSTSAFQLTNSPAKPNLFSGTTVDSTDGAGATIEYKFVINSSTWEGRANRAYTITSTNAQVIPTAYFDDKSGMGSLSLVKSGKNLATVSWGTLTTPFRLQMTANLNGGVWQDVPLSPGQSTFDVSTEQGMGFFRVVAP